MNVCFLLPLLWVLGASVLAGILGWLWGKKDGASAAMPDTGKDLEIQNLKKQVVEVKEKADLSLATLGRESREMEEKVNLWREKFNKLQMQSNFGNDAGKSNKELKAAKELIAKLELENKTLSLAAKAKKATPVPTPKATPETTSKSIAKSKPIDKDMISKVKKEYKSELKKLKAKLKKSKAKYKTLKKSKAQGNVTKEIQITKSIDIEALKKMIDKMPLKKISEEVINKEVE